MAPDIESNAELDSEVDRDFGETLALAGWYSGDGGGPVSSVGGDRIADLHDGYWVSQHWDDSEATQEAFKAPTTNDEVINVLAGFIMDGYVDAAAAVLEPLDISNRLEPPVRSRIAYLLEDVNEKTEIEFFLPSSILSELRASLGASDARYRQIREAISRPLDQDSRTFFDELLSLSGTGETWEDIVDPPKAAAYVAHRRGADQAQRVRMQAWEDDWDAILAETRDEGTAPDRLRELLAEHGDHLWEELDHHPGVTPDVLLNWATSDEEEVLLFVSGDQRTPNDALTTLATTPVAGLLIHRRDLPATVVRLIADNPDDEVRRSLVVEPDLGTTFTDYSDDTQHALIEAWQMLSADHDPLIRDLAAKRLAERAGHFRDR